MYSRIATLFAALNTLDGSIISMCDDRHRHQEWLKFLRVIDDLTPPDKQLHLIADNYATHKHPRVQRWLTRHPRVHMRFTPTSSSWLNMVERFFRDLTDKRLRRGVFRDVEELIMAILEYIDHHNRAPKPFIWTALGCCEYIAVCRLGGAGTTPNRWSGCELGGLRPLEGMVKRRNRRKRKAVMVSDARIISIDPSSVVRHAECRLSRAFLARLTFSRMSAALAVQLKGLGARL
jgi:transposase